MDVLLKNKKKIIEINRRLNCLFHRQRVMVQQNSWVCLFFFSEQEFRLNW